METTIHDSFRHIILDVLDKVLDTCDVSPDLAVSILKQVEYELNFSLWGGLDEPE
jgi:hypothetical protein